MAKPNRGAPAPSPRRDHDQSSPARQAHVTRAGMKWRGRTFPAGHELRLTADEAAQLGDLVEPVA